MVHEETIYPSFKSSLHPEEFSISLPAGTSDVATRQYVRSATTAPSHQSTESGVANFSPLQADSDGSLTDRLGGCRLQSLSLETNSRQTNPHKRISNLLEINHYIERSSEGLILTELRGIPALSGLDVELAHEWLTVHADLATVFITVDNKGDWIMRQMPRIRQERLWLRSFIAGEGIWNAMLVYRYKQLQKKLLAFSIAVCSDLNPQ
ncbi:hypothetical protein AAC387_Pa03g2333 [Persea americana]